MCETATKAKVAVTCIEDPIPPAHDSFEAPASGFVYVIPPLLSE